LCSVFSHSIASSKHFFQKPKYRQNIGIFFELLKNTVIGSNGSGKNRAQGMNPITHRASKMSILFMLETTRVKTFPSPL
jgi:hypothetical protein